MRQALGAAAKAIAKAPIHAYRWTVKPWLGWECRHLPTCSEYALEAIDLNGAWRGGWLTLARLCRCHPWGTHGYDPVPDIRLARHPLAPWRYGRWRQVSGGRDQASGSAAAIKPDP
ncbi:MAG: membrane protein insertion efficiency factor YidD [Hyphomicrobiaceae bacterium]